MLAEERKSGKTAAFELDSLHLVDLSNILKTHHLTNELERRIFHTPAAAAWNNEVFSFMPELQERFEHHVILMAMRDHNIINHWRKVLKCESIYTAQVFV